MLLVVLGSGAVAGPAVDSNAPLTGKGTEAIIDESSSPAIVVNPTQPGNLVSVNRMDRPRYSAALHWSTDYGRSWRDESLPLPAGRDRPYAPDAAFGPDGVLYVSYVNLEGSGNDPQTLWVSRSTDGGRSLAAPVQVAGRYSFQARLVAGSRGRVYVTWLEGSTVGLLSLNQPAPVVMATSTDRAATFSAPVQVSDHGRARVGAATPVLDSEGNIVVLYEDFNGDARDFLNLDGPTWDSPFTLVLARSTDHGRSFSAGVTVDNGVLPSERFLVYLPRFPSIAAGPDHSLFVSWADGRSGADRVFIRRSGDGGTSWGARGLVSTLPAGIGISAWLPRVSVAPNGRVDVLYLGGHRDSGDGLINAYLATSTDHGTTFSGARVSTSAFNSRIGPLTGPAYLPPDLGTQLGLQSSDSGAVAAWVDTRLGTPDNGRQDIFFAAIHVSEGDLSPVRVTGIALLFALAVTLAVVFFRRTAPRHSARRR